MSIDFRTTLAPDNASPRLARVFVRESLEGRIEPAVLDDLLLLTSEIVTNVVRHARTEAELRLDVGDDRVQLSCKDGCPILPQRRYPEPHEEDGRGLFLIQSIATAWGVEALAGDSKVVWVSLDRPAPG